MSNPHFAIKRISSRALPIVAILTLLVTIARPALSQTLQTLYRFSGGADGAFPRTGVIFGADGNLYGMSSAEFYGSAIGAVFQLTPFGGFTVLHSFTGTPDGANPYGGLAFDALGNLYGTTAFGGTYGYGTVFAMTTTGTETVLHNFPFPSPPSTPHTPWVPQGGVPTATVVFDAQGNLYSTTAFGSSVPPGPCDTCGGLFKLTTSGIEKLLHNFTGTPHDGASPGDLVIDAQGNLYGSAGVGGPSNDGIAFMLDPAGQETLLHNFVGSPNDGAGPGDLIMDSQGNFYGTTGQGGVYGHGTIFKLTSTGAETVLYNFAGGTDGAYPSGRLVMDSQGNLYGTTEGGGAYGWGTVFELTLSGTETVLYTFTGGTDGGAPFSGLAFKGGAFYGATYLGGNEMACVTRKQKGCGTIFVFTP
jgi:uncharacterized repeat protein (TIGR03803 family)